MTSPRTPRQWHAGDPEPGDLPNVRDKHGRVWSWDKPYTPGASPWCLEGAEAMTWIGRRQWQELADFHGPLSEVLPETPEPQLLAKAATLVIGERHGSVSFVQRKLGCGFAVAMELMDALEALGAVGPQDGSMARVLLMGAHHLPLLLKRIQQGPVPASQSVPAVPVSSTGGKETGEAAEDGTEALNAAGVGSLSEAIGLALNDTYAGLEFEDPTFESGTMAIMAVLRERLAGWRPPLPGCGCQPFDFCEKCWGPEQRREAAIRQLAYCEEIIPSGPEDAEQCPNPRELGSVHCAQHQPRPLPDSETEPCPDGECNQGMCGGISDPAGPCGGCCGCLGGCLDAGSPALSGEALRDVEERDDAAEDVDHG